MRVTPVVEVDAGATWFKLELLQHTGTFKARGAFNRVLSARESGELDARVGIVVASSPRSPPGRASAGPSCSRRWTSTRSLSPSAAAG